MVQVLDFTSKVPLQGKSAQMEEPAIKEINVRSAGAIRH